MTVLGPSGQPVAPEAKVEVVDALSTAPSRQQKRAYLRFVAMLNINKKAGGEPRRIRRAMAFTLAKRSAFIEEVKGATTRRIRL